MSGLSSTLSIAKTAIYAQQNGLSVTGNNVANANNPNYSVQNVQLTNRISTQYGGQLYGTGVDTAQVLQNVDRFLETRLTNESSTQMAYDETASYMRILESYFSETSDTSLRSTMVDFWNAWHTLSNNALGTSERLAVLEKGSTLAHRLNEADEKLGKMTHDLNGELRTAIDRVNALTQQIADINIQIASLETQHSANDLKDQRNAMVNELADYMEIHIIQKDNGTVLINTVQGQNLVIDKEYNILKMDGDQIILEGSGTNEANITDKLTRGKMAGWLEVRDAIIPNIQNELDVLAKDLVWAVNDQHAQGAGLGYYTDDVVGEYQFDESGLFSTLDYGNKIDASQMFVMWLQDQTAANSDYAKTSMDMGVSSARVSGWQGQASIAGEYSYRLTVMEDGYIGEKEVIETDGGTLQAPASHADNDMNKALSQVLSDQILYVETGNKERTEIKIQQEGGGAIKSAASIAKALSQVDGVDAYASEVTAGLDVTSGISHAHNGDTIQFSLWVDGVASTQSFTRDDQAGSLTEQFETALLNAAQAINNINEDKDLTVDGLNITSSTGRSLGIHGFEVLDNARVSINNFDNFTAGDTVTFTVSTNGYGPTPDATETDISFEIPEGTDTTDQTVMSALFYQEMKKALDNKPFEISRNESTNTLSLTATDGSSTLTLKDGDSSTSTTAHFSVTAASPSTTAASEFQLNSTTTDVTINAATNTGDTLNFTSQGNTVTIGEYGGSDDRSGVIVGTVSIFTEPGTKVYTDESDPAYGLFDGNWSSPGASVITLGGPDGFTGFDAGDTMAFKIDGYTVSVPHPGAGSASYQMAQAIENTLVPAPPGSPILPADKYKVIRRGAYVSIIKNKDDNTPIKITEFKETSGDGNATLSISTGMGKGFRDPENDLLEAGNPLRNAATSVSTSDPAIIRWEKLTADGLFTGQSGLIDVEDEGVLHIEEKGIPSLSFNIAAGDLVAGNTLTVNTDRRGHPDPLDVTIAGNANQANEVYTFKVDNGGKVGKLADKDEGPITIQWHTPTRSGSFELPGEDPMQTPQIPITVEVDGMILKFADGTLFDNDVFTITTDATGNPLSKNADGTPTGDLMSQWHWTLDTFTESFNRQAQGITASATPDNRISFGACETYYAFEEMDYSGRNGFDEENVTIDVKDWGALNFIADDLQIHRSVDGVWGVANDSSGGYTLLPEGGDDQGFGIDFNGDGLADIQLRFADRVTGEGYVGFDLVKRDVQDLNFAFSDPSGVAAAMGVNTFFQGNDAGTISVSSHITDTDHIASGRIDNNTGEISQGDNTNAIALANVQNKDMDMQQWSHSRGRAASSTIIATSLDGYQITMTGALGIASHKINAAMTYSESLVNHLTEQRNAISGVSLDEEMIHLMRFQHGFTAASKLLSTTDEMIMTLINTR